MKIRPRNIFRASEVDPNRPEGWIVDCSPADQVNPDCYWHFTTRKDAKLFADLVNGGMDTRTAYHFVYPEIRS